MREGLPVENSLLLIKKIYFENQESGTLIKEIEKKRRREERR